MALDSGQHVENWQGEYKSYVDFYMDYIKAKKNSSNEVDQHVAQRLTQLFSSLWSDEHFWHLVKQMIDARTEDSGKSLEKAPLEERERNMWRALKDAAEQYRLEQEIKIDPLTKARNRRGLDEDMKHTAEKSPTKSAVLVFMDIDKLKEANDALGHDGGDALLIEIARRLKAAVAKYCKSGEAYRFGGDEYGLLLLDDTMDKQEVLTTLSQIMDEVTQTQIEYQGKRWNPELSCGVIFTDGQHLSQPVTMQTADRLMYLAKTTTGREVRNKPEGAQTFANSAAKSALVGRLESLWSLAWLDRSGTLEDFDPTTNMLFSRLGSASREPRIQY